ncbi:phosphatase PAP2 family protein [Limisalsivibrio acetivorans]|uniref:phosphatase PAP2 family protein n=1 Tax=Limisalsivibrio acetivorans TaxID=1304888 RepID=UPI0003B319AF|nr:phosphatase PAP2 family protein [Limisalsivibrio acetivorans]
MKFIWKRYDKYIFAAIVAALFCFFYFDIPVIEYFDTIPDPVHEFFDDVTIYGSALYSLLAGLIMWAVFRKSDRKVARTGIFLFWSVAVSGLLVDLIKFLAGRYRPTLYFSDNKYGLDFLEYAYEMVSFPSGHSATAFAVGTTFALLIPRSGWFFYPFAALVAFSRIAITKHYPSDVIIGSMFGYLTAVYLLERFYPDLKSANRKKESGQADKNITPKG